MTSFYSFVYCLGVFALLTKIGNITAAAVAKPEPTAKPISLHFNGNTNGDGGGVGIAEYAIISSTTVGTPTNVGIDDVALIVYDDVGINDGVEFSAYPSSNQFRVKPCKTNQPDTNECIMGLFKQIVPQLKDGLPEWGIPSVEPYFVKRGIFRYSNEGIQGGLLIKNVNIRGLTGLKINNLIANFTGNNFIIKLEAALPYLNAEGQFKADVKFGGLRLAPKGPFNITLENAKAVVLTDGAIVNTPAGPRVQLHRLNANVGIGNAFVVANGIFSDKNLNSMILNLVNENLLEIIRVGVPATKDQWSPILVDNLNKFFENVPTDKFLIISN